MLSNINKTMRMFLTAVLLVSGILGIAAKETGHFKLVGNEAKEFDGTTFISRKSQTALNLSGDMTVSARFYVDTMTTEWVRIVGKGSYDERNYGLWYNNSGQALFQIYCSNGSNVDIRSGSNAIQAGRWYELTGVVSGTSAKLYLDEVEVASGSINGTPYINSEPLTIGYGNMHSYHKGKISNVVVSNEAMDRKEVKSLFMEPEIILYDTAEYFNGSRVISNDSSESNQLDYNMTISAQFYIDTMTNDWVRIVGKGVGSQRNYGLWYKSSGEVTFQINDGYGNWYDIRSDANSIVAGRWYQLTGVKEGTSMKLYLNEVEVASGTISGEPVLTSAPLTIGYCGMHTYHRGKIRKVVVSHSAMTPQGVNGLFTENSIEVSISVNDSAKQLASDGKAIIIAGLPKGIAIAGKAARPKYNDELGYFQIVDREAFIGDELKLSVPLGFMGDINLSYYAYKGDSRDMMQIIGDDPFMMTGPVQIVDTPIILDNSYKVADDDKYDLTGDVTVSARFYLDSLPSYPSNTGMANLVGKGDGNIWYNNYQLSLHKNNSIMFGVGDGDNWKSVYTDDGYFQAGQWYDVVGVKDGNTLKLYVNGTLVATSTTDISPGANSAPLRVGSPHLVGKMSNVMVSSEAKTPQQIEDYYARTKIGTFSYTANPSEEGLLYGASGSGKVTESYTKQIIGDQYYILAGTGPVYESDSTVLSSEGFISLPDAPEYKLTGDFTLKATFYLDSLKDSFRTLIKKGNGNFSSQNYSIGVNSLNSLVFNIGNWQLGTYAALFSDTGLIHANQWYDVCAVKEGNSMRLYLNGVLIESGTIDFTPSTINQPLIIGDPYVAGKLRNVMISNNGAGTGLSDLATTSTAVGTTSTEVIGDEPFISAGTGPVYENDSPVLSSEGFISLDDAPEYNLTGDFSLKVNFYLDSLTNSYRTLIKKGHDNFRSQNYGLGINSLGSLVFNIGNWQQGKSATLFSDRELIKAGQWYEVHAIKEGSSIRMYLNGELLRSGTIDFTPGTIDQPLIISGPYVAGKLSNVVISKHSEATGVSEQEVSEQIVTTQLKTVPLNIIINPLFEKYGSSVQITLSGIPSETSIVNHNNKRLAIVNGTATVSSSDELKGLNLLTSTETGSFTMTASLTGSYNNVAYATSKKIYINTDSITTTPNGKKQLAFPGKRVDYQVKRIGNSFEVTSLVVTDDNPAYLITRIAMTDVDYIVFDDGVVGTSQFHTSMDITGAFNGRTVDDSTFVFVTNVPVGMTINNSIPMGSGVYAIPANEFNTEASTSIDIDFSTLNLDAELNLGVSVIKVINTEFEKELWGKARVNGYATAKAYAEAGIDANASIGPDGVNVEARAYIEAGLVATAGGSFSYEGVGSAEVEAEASVTVQAEIFTEIDANRNGVRVANGASVEAQASVTGELTIEADFLPGTQVQSGGTAGVIAYAFIKSDGQLCFGNGKYGTSVEAGAEAGIMATADVYGSASVCGVGAGGGYGVSAGLGAGASGGGEAMYDDGEISLGFSGYGALLVGMKMDVNVTIDTGAVIEAGTLIASGFTTVENAIAQNYITAAKAILAGYIDAEKAITDGFIAVDSAIQQGFYSSITAIENGMISVVHALRSGYIGASQAIGAGYISAANAINSGFISGYDALCQKLISPEDAYEHFGVSADAIEGLGYDISDSIGDFFDSLF